MKKCSSKRAKELFLALKLHLTSGYDFNQFGGHLRRGSKTTNQFEAEKISSQLKTEEYVRDFFIANLLESFLSGRMMTYIGEYIDQDCIKVWNEWQGRQDTLSYKFNEDLKKLNRPLKELIILEKGQTHPILIRELMARRIMPETVAIIIRLCPKLPKYWLSNTSDPFMLPEVVHFIKNYSTLLNFDEEKFRQVLQSNIHIEHTMS